MNISLVFIGLGRYNIFWDEFYRSFSRNFCIGANLTFHVFLSESLPNHLKYPNCYFYHQDFLGWPFSTLYRYRILLRAEEVLRLSEYVVFFNANAVCLAPVSFVEFFGKTRNDSLVAAVHPGYSASPSRFYPVECRIESTAFFSSPAYYFQGCINGGSTLMFLDVCHQLAQNIESDLDHGIVALWHDESHWNKCIHEAMSQGNVAVSILDHRYLWPEGFYESIAANVRIIMRDKTKYGGHDFLRVNSPPIRRSLMEKVFESVRQLKKVWVSRV